MKFSSSSCTRYIIRKFQKMPLPATTLSPFCENFVKKTKLTGNELFPPQILSQKCQKSTRGNAEYPAEF